MRAMILAAGRGERMLPLTNKTPKPLLKVAGVTLLERHLLRLVNAGFHEVVINASHLAEHIIAFCGDGSRWGLSINLSIEEEPLETAGGIARALPLLGDAPFAVVNGDIHTDFPFERLTQITPVAAGAHLVLVPNPPHHTQGDFSFALNAGNNEDECSSGPLSVAAQGSATLTYSGIGVYTPQMFEQVPNGKYPLRPVLQERCAKGLLSGERYGGHWEDIGTPQRLNALNQSMIRS